MRPIKIGVVFSFFLLASVFVSGEWVRPQFDETSTALLAANSTPWTNNSNSIIIRDGFPGNVNLTGGTLRAGNLLPDSNNTGSIGFLDLRWNQLFVQIANISELGGFSPIIVSTEMISSRNITANFFKGSGRDLTDINASNSNVSNFAGNSTFSNSSSFATSAGSADAVDCEDIVASGDITDFCNRINDSVIINISSDGKWIVQDNNIYNLTGNVGIGLANPGAKLHIINHSRISTSGVGNNYRSTLVGDVLDVSDTTTLFTITTSNIALYETLTSVYVTVKGNNNESGNGNIETEWSIEVTGGSLVVSERRRDEFQSAPKVLVSSSGNDITINVSSRNLGTDTFNGFILIEFDATIGGGTNGKTSTWTIN